MNRKLFLTTLATLSLAAVPVFAQPSAGYRRPAPRPVAKPMPTPTPSISSYAPQSAVPGTTVTIRGINFVPGTRVMLGGVAITPRTVSHRAIKFAIPTGALGGALSLDVPNRRRHLRVGALDIIEPQPRVKRRGTTDAGWGATRSRRRASSRRGIFARWNNRAFLRSPEVVAELEMHARRLARLNRIKRLTTSSRHSRLAVRVNRAIKRENARHDRAMAKLEKSFGARGTRNGGRRVGGLY